VKYLHQIKDFDHHCYSRSLELFQLKREDTPIEMQLQVLSQKLAKTELEIEQISS